MKITKKYILIGMNSRVTRPSKLYQIITQGILQDSNRPKFTYRPVLPSVTDLRMDRSYM